MEACVSEAQIQKAIVQGLRQLLPWGWLIQSTANKPRSKVAGAIEKSMGAIAGWPDLAVYGPACAPRELSPPTWFIEVKAGKGRLSEAQREVHDRLKDLGYGVGVARSLDDALALGLAWRWPLRLSADKGRLS
jgi:hypothetical protein